MPPPDAIAAAAEFMIESDVAAVHAQEGELLQALQGGLEAIPGVTVRGPSATSERAPTVVFTVDGLSPEQVDQRLAERRIAVWHGDNYACELVDAMGLRASGGLVRAGIARYTNRADVEALVGAVREIAAGG